MAKETSATRHCIDCDIEIIYCGLEAPKDARCSKCQKELDSNNGRKPKKASK